MAQPDTPTRLALASVREQIDKLRHDPDADPPRLAALYDEEIELHLLAVEEATTTTRPKTRRVVYNAPREEPSESQ